MLITIAVSMMSIGTASAAYWLNGSVRDSNTGAMIANVWVQNETNMTQFDYTGADGFFNITGYGNSAGTNSSLRFNSSGYTEMYVISIVAGGSSNETYGTTTYVSMTPITPVNGAVTVASITKDAATVAWTVNTPFDNVSNNYVDQKLVIMASGISNLTQAWTNSSLVNSYTLSNLQPSQVYTYYALTYNTANNAFTDQDSATFTTLRAGVSSSYVEPTPFVAAPKKSALDVITSKNKTGSQRNVIIVMIVAIVAVVIYFGVIAKGGTGGKRKGR